MLLPVQNLRKLNENNCFIKKNVNLKCLYFFPLIFENPKSLE